MLDPVIADPMFTPPPYKALQIGTDIRIPKWNESEIAKMEKAINLKIGELEAEYYRLRYHQQTPDANSYRGGKNEFGEREGVGRVELDNGDIYLGQWRKNLRHGTGGMVFAGGDTYESEWAFGDPHGFGVFRNHEGYKYSGDFVAGEPNGFGRSYVSRQLSYLGTFREGKPHGYGKWANNEHTYIGEFINGKREGLGKLTDAAGNVVFDGEFRNDQPIRAGWQKKPKYRANPDTNTDQTLGTTADMEEEREISVMSFDPGRS